MTSAAGPKHLEGLGAAAGKAPRNARGKQSAWRGNQQTNLTQPKIIKELYEFKGGAWMSDYQQFLDERDKIDFLIQKGYQISGVNEHLNGATVEFVHPNGNITEILKIGTANARKYFTSLLLKQNHTS